MQNKVSVIVPAYNVENYIEGCVQSLIKQTYNNIEIIIVEDCSNDNTLNKCRRLASSYENITLLIHEKNQGLEGTREDGIAAATGKWIMFLDSDDTYQLDGIKRVIESAKDSDPDIIICPYSRVVDGGINICSLGIKQDRYNPKDLCKKLFTELPIDVLSCIGSKIYRRDFITQNNIHFDKRYKYNEDGAYIYSCLAKADNIIASDISFYQYNIRTSGSIQSSYRIDMFKSISNSDFLLRDVLTHYDCFIGGVKSGYFKRRASIMLASLENEAKYKNFSAFRRTSHTIRGDADFNDAYAVVMTRNTNKVLKVMMLCIRLHLDFAFYCVLKSTATRTK